MCVCEFCAQSQVLWFYFSLLPSEKQLYRTTVNPAYQDPYLGFLLGSKGGNQVKYKEQQFRIERGRGWMAVSKKHRIFTTVCEVQS